MGFLNRDVGTQALSVALEALDAAFAQYESAETCWRLTRSIRAAAVDKGATPLALEDHEQDIENARVELLVARKHLDDATRDVLAARRQTLAANDQAAE